MKKLTFLTLILTLCSFFCFAQFVGIGTTDPRAKLDVNGNIRIGDGTQGAGKVLTSDATGRASWQTLSTTSGFGAWGDCSTSNISGYNPITASNGTIQDKFGTSASIMQLWGLLIKPLVLTPRREQPIFIFLTEPIGWSSKC